MYNRFDRIILSLPYHNYDKVESIFEKTYDPSGELIKEKCSRHGLRISINHISRRVTVDLSSKILKSKFLECIHKENIVEVHNNLSKYISIPYDLLLESRPLKAEITTDIYHKDIAWAIDCLHHLSKLQTKYRPSEKPHKHNKKATSMWLKKAIITRKITEFVSIYNKKNEVTDSSVRENVSLLDSLTGLEHEHIIDKCINRLRIETKFPSRQLMRTRFQLGVDFTFNDLLNLSENVNHDQMQRVYKEEMLELRKVVSFTHKELDKLSTLERFDYDLNRIYETLRLMGQSRQRSKVIKPYSDLLRRKIESEENEKILTVKELIEQIKW